MAITKIKYIGRVKTSLSIQFVVGWNQDSYRIKNLDQPRKYSEVSSFFSYLAYLVDQNKCIFQDKKPDVSYAVLSIKNHLQLYHVIAQQKKLRRNIAPAPILNFPAGFFDGASTKHMGGVGVHLLLSQNHYYYFKLGVGLSTNTRSELLALWTLLQCAKIMGLPHLHIHGDYAVIINWFIHRSTLSLLTLDGWCHFIRELEPHFIQLSSIHIQREHNTTVDSLSKEALTLAFTEFTTGECIDQGSYFLFQPSALDLQCVLQLFVTSFGCWLWMSTIYYSFTLFNASFDQLTQ